jgi:V/A-type H+-transporting ATPase subunit I
VAAARQALVEAEDAWAQIAPLARRADGGELAPGAKREPTVEQVLALAARRKSLENRRGELTRFCAEWAPLGSFDSARIRELAAAGVIVRVYRHAGREMPAVPEGVTYVPLAEEAGGVRWFALIGRGDFAAGAREVTLPDRSLAEVEEDLRLVEAEAVAIGEELKGLAAKADFFRAEVSRRAEALEYIEARDRMGGGNGVIYLRGFCPIDRIERLTVAAREYSWGLFITDPSDEDRVPTMIRSPAWVRPIRVLFKMLDIVPGYREADTRPAFLIFFSIFFGMLINDAGYGVLMLLMAWAVRRRFRDAPAEPFRLFGLLSVCSIVWGVLTGGYFGIAHPPEVLRVLEISWLKNDRNLMTLCFLMGAVHLTVAHAWRTFLLINSTRALAQLGWIVVTWVMFFMARMLILDEALPEWTMKAFLAGLTLVICFMTPVRRLKQEWSEHVMLPFSVIGSFADLVSYVRLFAVGTAGMAVAEAFNELALHGGVEGWKAGLASVLILGVGHGLNVILALMSVLVHGVRLNTLEFSGHVGLEWSGFAYRPFGESASAELG